MDRPENVRILHDLQRSTHTMRLLTIIALVWIGLLTICAGYFTIRAWQDTNDVQDAVCTFREDLQTRLDQTRDYLNKNPDGFPGISQAQITQSLRNQQATIDSLRFLDCEKNPEREKAKAFSRSAFRAQVQSNLISTPMPPSTTTRDGPGGTTQRASPRPEGRRSESEPPSTTALVTAAIVTVAVAIDAIT